MYSHELPFETYLPVRVVNWMRKTRPFRWLVYRRKIPFRKEALDDQQFDFSGIIVHWAGSLGLGMTGLGIADESDVTKNSYAISGTHLILRIENAQLSIQYLARKYRYGTVKAGDRIEVSGHSEIILNGNKVAPSNVDRGVIS